MENVLLGELGRRAHQRAHNQVPGHCVTKTNGGPAGEVLLALCAVQWAVMSCAAVLCLCGVKRSSESGRKTRKILPVVIKTYRSACPRQDSRHLTEVLPLGPRDDRGKSNLKAVRPKLPTMMTMLADNGLAFSTLAVLRVPAISVCLS